MIYSFVCVELSSPSSQTHRHDSIVLPRPPLRGVGVKSRHLQAVQVSLSVVKAQLGEVTVRYWGPEVVQFNDARQPNAHPLHVVSGTNISP